MHKLTSSSLQGHYDANNHTNFPAMPMRRDTLMVRPNGNFVVRFRADNPGTTLTPLSFAHTLTVHVLGVWFFHCHIDWHLASGLAATLIEAPLDLQRSLIIPEDHLEVCRAAGVPVAGNAAGNTVDVLDLKGQNEMVHPLPSGFTARGIVALVFSCISAFLGMAVIAW